MREEMGSKLKTFLHPTEKNWSVDPWLHACVIYPLQV